MKRKLKERLKWLGVLKRRLIVLNWKTGRAIHIFVYHHFNNYIFIHINKTGGSSIEKALNIPTEHKTALEKIEEIGIKSWNKKLTFTVIRNPWDKVVSQYHYRVSTNQTNLRDNPVEFKEWVNLVYGEQDSYYYDTPKMFLPQLDWITDHNGKILIDAIIRFENLQNDFNDILAKLGRTKTLPHIKKSKRGNYREYYDEETIEIVRNWFMEDIDKFDYQF